VVAPLRCIKCGRTPDFIGRFSAGDQPLTSNRPSEF
jgi:hypothetical protein